MFVVVMLCVLFVFCVYCCGCDTDCVFFMCVWCDQTHDDGCDDCDTDAVVACADIACTCGCGGVFGVVVLHTGGVFVDCVGVVVCCVVMLMFVFLVYVGLVDVMYVFIMLVVL